MGDTEEIDVVFRAFRGSFRPSVVQSRLTQIKFSFNQKLADFERGEEAAREILFQRAFSGKPSLRRALLPGHPQGLKFFLR
jgi:hypothetical protein